jgi:hypothetical protein
VGVLLLAAEPLAVLPQERQVAQQEQLEPQQEQLALQQEQVLQLPLQQQLVSLLLPQLLLQ